MICNVYCHLLIPNKNFGKITKKISKLFNPFNGMIGMKYHWSSVIKIRKYNATCNKLYIAPK